MYIWDRTHISIWSNLYVGKLLEILKAVNWICVSDRASSCWHLHEYNITSWLHIEYNTQVLLHSLYTTSFLCFCSFHSFLWSRVLIVFKSSTVTLGQSAQTCSTLHKCDLYGKCTKYWVCKDIRITQLISIWVARLLIWCYYVYSV